MPIANARGTNAHLEVVVLWTTGASAADIMEAMKQRRRSTRRLRVRRCRRGGTRWLFFRYPQAGLFGGPESTAFGSTANRFHQRWASRDEQTVVSGLDSCVFSRALDRLPNNAITTAHSVRRADGSLRWRRAHLPSQPERVTCTPFENCVTLRYSPEVFWSTREIQIKSCFFD